MQNLASCKKVKVSDALDVFIFGGSIWEDILGPNMMFVRKFYDDLLRVVRSRKKVVLIGNPGIGKSSFQQYYLSRILNPSLLGQLPPDINGCTAPPSVVVREVAEKFEIYDIKNRTAYTLIGDSDIELLRCFDPEKTIYLHEPGDTKKGPRYLNLDLPTLSTVSPDTSRYKEFVKNKGKELYMPTYSCAELLSAGEYLLQNCSMSNELKAIYSSEQIRNRYHEFGGIVRYVLPSNFDELMQARVSKQKALGKCNAEYVFGEGTLETGESHHLLQMNVTTSGPLKFQEYVSEFVSDDVRDFMEKKVKHLDLNERILILIKYGETGSYPVICRSL